MIKLIKKIYQQNWYFADTVYLYIWTSVIMTIIGFCFSGDKYDLGTLLLLAPFLPMSIIFSPFSGNLWWYSLILSVWTLLINAYKLCAEDSRLNLSLKQISKALSVLSVLYLMFAFCHFILSFLIKG